MGLFACILGLITQGISNLARECENYMDIWALMQEKKVRVQRSGINTIKYHTNGKVSNSQLDTTNESQEVSSFPAGDHKAPDCSLRTTTAQTSLHIRAV